MSWQRQLAFLVFVACHVYFVDSIDIILGDKVTFPGTEPCKINGSKLVHRLSGQETQPVAYWKDEWKPEPGYESRMSPGDKVVLNETIINDGGLYEFKCGTDEQLLIQLNFFQASVVSVAEGVNATLPFHHSTLEGTVRSVRCERNGKVVYQLDFSKKNPTYSSAFSGRISLRPDWNKTGDLSLTVQRVEPEDGGDYIFCGLDEHGNRVKGSSAAVRMRVTKMNPDQTTCTPSPLSPAATKEERMTTGAIVGITAAVVSIVVAPLAFLCGKLCSRFLACLCGMLCCRKYCGKSRVKDPGMGLTERDPALRESNCNREVI